MNLRTVFATLLVLCPLSLDAQQNTEPGKKSELLDTLVLKSSVVSARVEPVRTVADTVVFNAASFRTGDDAAVDELLGKIPGVEIDENGNVTIYGRPVKQLLINGKRVFGGSVKTAINSIPADIISEVRTYDRESDEARITGIDDGEQQTVIDLTVKKHLMMGWNGKLSAGAGTMSRYNASANLNRIGDSLQVVATCSVNNTGGKAGFRNAASNKTGTGSTGDMDSRTAAVTFNGLRPSSTIEGAVNYTGNSAFKDSRSRTESILTSGSNWSVGRRSANSTADNLDASATFEWRPDKNNTFRLSPTLRFAHTGEESAVESSVYKQDPSGMNAAEEAGARVTGSSTTMDKWSLRYYAGISGLWSHRMTNRRRSLTISGGGSASSSPNEQVQDRSTRYFRIKSNPDSVKVLQQQIVQNSPMSSIFGQCSWNEPLARKLSLQLSWRTELKLTRSDRSLYDISLPEPSFLSDLSYSGQSRFLSCNGSVNLRYVTKAVKLTSGVSLRPQTFSLTYPSGGSRKTVTHPLFCVSPNINVDWKLDGNRKLSLIWRSYPGIPSIYDLLPVENGTNPLSVHVGNPDLLPSLTNNVNLSWRASNKAARSSLVAELNASSIKRKVSQSTTYIEETGGRVVTPRNIDGNWNAGGYLSATKTFGDGGFSISGRGSAQYRNEVNYLYNNKSRSDELNQIHRLMLRGALDASYRCGFLELILTGGADCTDERSLLRPEMDRRPYNLYAGFSAVADFPWKMRLNTDITATTQRRYLYDELNRDYFVWNLSLSQPLLKRRATVRLQWHDILRSLDSTVQSFSASSRSMSTFNGVNSYLLLSFVYKFNR